MITKIYGSATKHGENCSAYDIDVYNDKPHLVYVTTHHNEYSNSRSASVILDLQSAITMKLHLTNAIRAAKKHIKENKMR